MKGSMLELCVHKNGKFETFKKSRFPTHVRNMFWIPSDISAMDDCLPVKNVIQLLFCFMYGMFSNALIYSKQLHSRPL